MVELGIALVALTVMEIVLGIDNIVFISILTSKLPKAQRPTARWFGLGAAMGTRILLLLCINWIMQLTSAIFLWSDLLDWLTSRLGDGTIEALGLEKAKEWLLDEHHETVNAVTWKDVVLLVGGLFLLNSSVREIHHKMEGFHEDHAEHGTGVSMLSVIIQIAILDIVFSLDSVITAVGMVNSGEHAPAGGIYVMITAIVIAVIVMMFFAGPVGTFVERHPTVKMLALSFLLLIGVMLIADAVGTHIDKGYIYFAMGFSLLVEMFNLRASARRKARLLKESEAGKLGSER
jgi:predicted tellurium resistance membrane protein TerC